MRIQIYEIQEPSEAARMIALGVHHIGSVLVSEEDWKKEAIREVMQTVTAASRIPSLIPLFHSKDVIFRVIDYYQPAILHFCEVICDHQTPLFELCHMLIDLQKEIRRRYKSLKIMRSIPIATTGLAHKVPTLALTRMFENVSDFFLTDTLILPEESHLKAPGTEEQPVKGFVGITGQTCDWEMARRLVATSRIPVILAGGLSSNNVFDAIIRVRPAGVDSCTLTNKTDVQGNPIRFQKDDAKVAQFVSATRRAETLRSKAPELI